MSSYSFTVADTQTFTITHARHIAAKVATDLKRVQRFYSYPSDTKIAELEAELVVMLKAGYLEEVTYGFKRGNDWIEPTLRYTAGELIDSGSDERGGEIAPGVSKKIHYLVVGEIGNEQWLHSTYGTKIKKAVELREGGSPLAIVSEQHWQKALFG